MRAKIEKARTVERLLDELRESDYRELRRRFDNICASETRALNRIEATIRLIDAHCEKNYLDKFGNNIFAQIRDSLITEPA